MTVRLALWRSVRGRLLLAAVLVEAVMLALLVTNSLRLLRDYMSEQVERQAAQIGPVLIAALVAPLAQRDYATVQAVLDESRAEHGIDYLVVVDASGKTAAASGWGRDTPLPDPDTRFELLGRDGLARYDVARPVALAGQKLGTLHFGLDLSQIVSARHALLTQGVIIAVGELMMSIGLLTVLGFWLTRHLAALTRASEAVAAGNLTPAPVAEGDDDIGRLGAAFNAMSRAVSERIGDLTNARDAQIQLIDAVEQEHARMLALLAAMDIGVLLVDPADHVVYENPAYRRIWRIAGDATVVGRNWAEVFAAAGVGVRNAEPWRQSLATVGEQFEPFEQFEIILNDERIVSQRLHAVADLAGQPLGRLWLFEDVTEDRRLAQQLLAAKEAAEAGQRAKAMFLATMSHEIRTPMNGIIGMTDLALMTELNEEQSEYLRWVKSSAESLLTVLNDVLDFSKIDAGRLEMEVLPFAPKELLDQITGLYSSIAAQKGLELNWRATGNLPQTLLGDPARLRQVLTNLISNALKFTERGSVAITVNAESTPANGRQWIGFSVTDTGIGIAQDKLDHIFSPFSQADSSTTRRFGGTGLGLAIAARLVELMGSQLGVDSEPGRGSTFHFGVVFSIGEAAGTGTETLPTPATVADGRPLGRILLVEDTPVNQRLGQALLGKRGYQVSLAADGLEALAAFDRERFDLILMDMQMPNMDGLEATRRIRDRELTGDCRIPIIALTANAMQSDRERCLAAGMDDFVAKPFRADEMFAVIEKYLTAAV
jgi:signal transduction histidine kinase/ActR/RegA family two-component response regulator/HAMP domain-containing protein